MSNLAPEYTKRERIVLVVKHLAWVAPLFAVSKLWFFPWLESYAAKAHCYKYGLFTGVHVVFYGVFVGLPLLSAIIVFILEGRRSIRVIQLGQNPLPNEKVFKTTKYSYGLKAKVKPIILLGILLFLIGLSMRGVFWANDIIDASRQKIMQPCDSG